MGYGARVPGHVPVHCRKQSIYLSEEMLDDLEALRRRTGRSISSILQAAWALSRDAVMQLPPKETTP